MGFFDNLENKLKLVCKKNIILLLFVCLFILNVCTIAYADSTKELVDGNRYYQNYLITKDKTFLDKAYLHYYKASELEPSASSYLGMGMVFLEKKMYARAKNYLYKAYSVDENDATINYYLAKFSYQNQDYIKALEFYNRAYFNGLSGNYDVNYSIAVIYEKVGDFSAAKKYYKAALRLNPNSVEVKERMAALELLETNKKKYFEN